MVAALQELESFCSIPAFSKTPILIFFSDKEELQQLIATHRIASQDVTFHDYLGHDDFHSACLYFSGLFETLVARYSCHHDHLRSLFIHFCNDDDAASPSALFLLETTKTIIRTKNLAHAGLILQISTTTTTSTSSNSADATQDYDNDDFDDETCLSDSSEGDCYASGL